MRKANVNIPAKEEKRKRGRPPKQDANKKQTPKCDDTAKPKKRGRPPKNTQTADKHDKGKTPTEQKQKKVRSVKSEKKLPLQPKIKTVRKTPKTTANSLKQERSSRTLRKKPSQDIKQEALTKPTTRKSAKNVQTKTKQKSQNSTEISKSSKLNLKENQHCVINCCSCNRSIYYDTKRTDSNANKTIERTSVVWGYVFCPHCGTANITRFKEDILGRLE